MEFQWYPGHMSKAMRIMKEDLKLIDVILELVDARIPYSSKNPDIDPLCNSKSRIIILNKADLADPEVLKIWEEYYTSKGFFVLQMNSKAGKGMKSVTNMINTACKEKLERNKKRGILNRPLRAMIVGIPNVGKSTFINSLVGRASAKTGNKPGVTKGKQWIKLNKNIELMDTPGVLWPKFDDMLIGQRLSFIGSIKDELVNTYELSVLLIEYLTEHYNAFLTEKYGIEGSDDPYEVLKQIAVVRGCKKAGDEVDTEKAAVLFIDDFRKGRLGRISLELPEDIDKKDIDKKDIDKKE